MFSLPASRAHKLFLWLAALALLTFVASFFPELRRAFQGRRPEPAPATEGRS